MVDNSHFIHREEDIKPGGSLTAAESGNVDSASKEHGRSSGINNNADNNHNDVPGDGEASATAAGDRGGSDDDGNTTREVQTNSYFATFRYFVG